MTNSTAAEHLLLRTQPQQQKRWLSIYQPGTAMAARVNDASAAKGLREVTYDGVTTGAYTDVKSGFVMLVGTSLGSDDKGRVRVRDITDTVITVGENSHITWADDDYLTILKFVEITPIYTRIIQDPANSLDVIFYKDYDIAYTNQNTILGAYVNMGCHYAGFLDAGGECGVYYDASVTSHLTTGTTMAYGWTFEGGNPATSTNVTPGYVKYTGSNHYLTTLIVSGSNGSSDTSYRCVSIYDHPSRGVNTPILKWSMTDLPGSRESGGYKTNIRIRSNVPEGTIRDGALVVIFTEDWYGGTKQSIGGNATNRQTIRFVGYILQGSIEYNSDDGHIDFEVISPTMVMQNCESFSVSVESKTAPTKWYELLNMNCKRAIYHYLRWHSTVLQCCDFEFKGNDFDIQYFDADRTSLYDAVHGLMDGTLHGSVVSDSQGKLYAETNYDAFSNGGTLTVHTNALDKQDWRGAPSLDERETEEVSFIEMGGIYYSGPAAGTSAAYLCCAPGTAPSYRGKIERVQGLALSSQAQLNTLAGNIFEHANSRYPDIEYKLKGNWRNFDIAPQEIIKLNIASSDTPRQITFTEKKFVITGVSDMWDANNLIALTSLNLAEVVTGKDGDTIIIPDIPPGQVSEPTGTTNPKNPNPPPTTTIVTGSVVVGQPSVISIYHNSLYFGLASALDFIDDFYTGSW